MKYLGANGIDMNNTPITTLAAGDSSSDAANAGQVGGVLVYNGVSSYVPDFDVRVYIRKSGDPAPSGLNENDIVLTES